MTPAEEMRAAAAKLREIADKASPGQWGPIQLSDAWGDQAGTWAIESVAPHDVLAESLSEPDASWVALMGPDKAELLAVWLEAQAASRRNGFVASMGDPSHVVAALAFARSILGGAS